MRTTVIAAAFAATMGFASPLLAATITHDINTVPNTTNNPTAATTSGTVYYDRVGSSGGNWRSPFENPNGTKIDPQFSNLPYTSIQANSWGIWNVDLSDTLKLFWGSPDNYNKVTFYSEINGGGVVVDFVSGEELFTPQGPVDPAQMGHDLVSILTDGFFRSVKLHSIGQNAFEFTNFQTSCEECALPPGETPIPGAVLLFGSVLAGGVGLMRRRQRIGARA